MRSAVMRLRDEWGDGSHAVIGACIEVHRQLGPGLLESAYDRALGHELSLRGLRFERQRIVPVRYKGIDLASEYRLDFVVENVVVELKAVAQILPVHEAQLRTYLKLTRIPVGLLVNFHVARLRDGGLRRLTLRSDP